jgi:hypothetical protein
MAPSVVFDKGGNFGIYFLCIVLCVLSIRSTVHHFWHQLATLRMRAIISALHHEVLHNS